MEYTKLSNDVRVPLLGLGTFMISPDDTETSVYEALKMGYRLIDTANAYLNEEAVGKGLKKAMDGGLVKRDDVFLSTKIWPPLYEKDDAVEKTLERLGVDYVDLLFIHQPAGQYQAGYALIEKAYKEGKARSLGISNFFGDKLESLLSAADVKPQVIQLETHPYYVYDDVMVRLAEYGTKLMGWYPLGHGDPGLLHDPMITKLSDKYRKSTVQILLRWAVQRDFMTIPGTKNIDHLRSNFDIFDFSLTDEEMAAVNALNGTRRYYTPSEELETRYANMHLPFEG